MGIYNIEVFLNEFSSRTIKNLKFIDDHVGYSDVFEVTQLINSLLGLIIIPVEKYKRNYLVNDTRLKEVSIADYLKIKNNASSG